MASDSWTDPVVLAKAQTEGVRLEQECVALRERADRLEGERKVSGDEARQSGEEVARLTERVKGLTEHTDKQSEQIRAIETQRDAAVDDAKTAGREVARLQEREIALANEVEKLTEQLANQQKELTTEFENIANRILRANAQELSEGSRKELGDILNPLRERIQAFETQVRTTYETESRDVLSLKEQIRLFVETGSAIGNQADGLAKALRGDSQFRGRWGELALERILEAAGLTEGREFVTQGRGLGLKSETGGAQKPDIVVMLPEKRTMVIDSKVPLISYDRLAAATDEGERTAFTSDLVRDVKGHIDDLAAKRYQENEKLAAHDCVLMFVPIEGALAAALKGDPDLFLYGWQQRVVLVGPATLLITMRTVASIWRYELQGQNAQEIARLAGDLCDKVSTSLSDLNLVAEKMSGALDAHNEAVKRLATGKGNALSIGERIRGLGVKTKKPIPSMVVNGVLVAASSDDCEEVSAEVHQ